MQRTVGAQIYEALTNIESVLNNTILAWNPDQLKQDFHKEVDTLVKKRLDEITALEDSQQKLEIFSSFLTDLATICTSENYKQDTALKSLFAAFADIVITAAKALNITVPPEFSQDRVTHDADAEKLLPGFTKAELEKIYNVTRLTPEQIVEISTEAQKNRFEEDEIEREANNRYQTLSSIPGDLIKARALLKIIASAVQKLSRQYPPSYKGAEEVQEPTEQLAIAQLSILRNIETKLLKFIRIKQKELTDANRQEISKLKSFRRLQSDSEEKPGVPSGVPDLSYPTRAYSQKSISKPDEQSADINQEQTYATFADLMTSIRANLHDIFKNYYLATMPKVFRGLFRFIIRTDQESANNEIITELKQYIIARVQETTKREVTTFTDALDIYNSPEFDQGIHLSKFTAKNKITAALKILAYKGEDNARQLLAKSNILTTLMPVDFQVLDDGRLGSILKKYNLSTSFLHEEQTQLLLQTDLNSLKQALSQWIQQTVTPDKTEMTLVEIMEHVETDNAVQEPTKSVVLATLKVIGLLGDQPLINAFGPHIHLSSADIRALKNPQIQSYFKKHNISTAQIIEKQTQLVKASAEKWIAQELEEILKVKVGELTQINTNEMSLSQVIDLLVNHNKPQDAIKKDKLLTHLKLLGIISSNQLVIEKLGPSIQLTTSDRRNLENPQLKLLLKKYFITRDMIKEKQDAMVAAHSMWMIAELQEYAESQMREKGFNFKLEYIPAALSHVSSSEFRLFGHNKKEQITVALKLLGIMGNQKMRDHFGPNIVLSPTDLKALTEPKIAMILKKYDFTEAQLIKKQEILIKENAHQWLKEALIMHIKLTISKAMNRDVTLEDALFLCQTDQLPSITVGSFNNKPIKLQEEMHTALGILSTLSDEYERIPPYLTDRDKIVLNRTKLKSVLLASHVTPTMLKQLENKKITQNSQNKDEVLFVSDVQQLLLATVQNHRNLPANEVIEELLMNGYSSSDIEKADPNISMMLKILGIMGNQKIIDHLGQKLEFTDAELKAMRDNQKLKLIFETHGNNLERLEMFKGRRLKQHKIRLEQERQKLQALMATLHALKDFIKNKSGIDFAALLEAFDDNQLSTLKIDEKLRTQLTAALKIIATLEPLQHLDPLQPSAVTDVAEQLGHRLILSANEWKSLESPELHAILQGPNDVKVIQELQEISLNNNDTRTWFKLALEDHITALMRELTANPLYSFANNPEQVLEHERFKALKPNSNVKKQIFATLKILALMGNIPIGDALGHNIILTTVDREQINTSSLKSILNQYHVVSTTLVEEIQRNHDILLNNHRKAWFEKELEELIRINAGEILGNPTISYADAMQKIHTNQLTPKKFSFFSKQANRDIINAALKILYKLDPQRYFGYDQSALTQNEVKVVLGPKMKPILEKYGYDISIFLPKQQRKPERSNQASV